MTFDDGPSSITENILDVLKAKNVKATFFVTYHNDADAIRRLRRIVRENHAIGLHSYTHRYEEIYSSVESFVNDIDKLNSYIVNSTGYTPKILRFPGGSNCSLLKQNLFDRLKTELDKRGYVYFDWNVSSADSTKNATSLSVGEIVGNCYSGAKDRNVAIILMHDTSVKKRIIVDALPILIDKLKRDGFVFSTLSTEAPQIAFRK